MQQHVDDGSVAPSGDDGKDDRSDADFVPQEDVPPLAEGEDWSHMNGHSKMVQEVA